MAGVGRGSFSIAAILLLVHTVTSAPVTEDGTSHSLQLADVNGDGRGCYYNYERYDEGDRILTNEPCLNCTCHNRMLMCYLRVCPFTKAIGQDCTVEKKPDQCCPIITCPQVPVALLTSSTTSESPPTTTALGRPDNYGCILEDNTFYPDGAQVPSDPRKPCELCYCIRNHTACVMQECTLNVEGCRPVYQEGVCCPVRYDCDYDEVQTTPKPLGLVTTPGGSSDCLHNGVVYHDGAMVLKDEKAPCEHCYCMRGDIVCAVQECGTPLEGTDCSPMEPIPGQCCPNYHCANGTAAPEVVASESTPTETTPDSVKEEDEQEKQGSEESSNESDSSSEESNESVAEQKPPQPVEPSSDGETSSHQVEPSTHAPVQENASDEISVTETSVSESDASPTSESSDEIAQTPKPQNTLAVDEHTADSDSEASQHQESEAQAPEEAAKDPEATNEIPESTPYEHSAVSVTTEEPVEVARIPGEGSCLVDGKTYAHNTVIPTANPCQELCRCFSSIVSCKPRDCPPAPSADENCMPVSTPGACCPTYMCDQKTSDAPVVQDHKIEPFSHEETPSTVQPTNDDHLETEAPVISGIPLDNLVPGSNEQGLPTESTEAPVGTHSEDKIETTEKPQSENNQVSSDENGHLNSHIVHGEDAALHGGQSEILDSHQNGDLPEHQGGDTTAQPVSEDNKLVEQTGEEGFNPVTTVNTDDSLSHTEAGLTSGQNEETVKPHTPDLPTLTEQDEGSGQEYIETPAEKPNESQDQTFPQESTESGNSPVEQTSTETIIKPDNEPAESGPEDHLQVANADVSSNSDEIKSEENGTDAPAVIDVSSEKIDHTTPDNTLQTDQQTDAPASGDTNVDEVPTFENQEPQQENIQEVATETVPENSADVSHDSVSEGTENSQKEEDIPAENTSVPEAEEQFNHGIDATAAAPVESHPEESTHVPIGQDVNEPMTHDDVRPTDAPVVPEENVSEVQPTQEDTHHVAVPEPLQPNVDISQDEIKSEVNEGESSPHEGTISEDKISETLSEDSNTDHIPPQSTSFTEAQDSEHVSADLGNSQNADENTEQDNKESSVIEQTTKVVISEETSTEKKPDDLSPSSPGVHEHETSPSPLSEGTSSVSSLNDQHEDFSTIIYEEVKVSGMPSIESHVTEGTSSTSTPIPDTHVVTEDVLIPGPEGIKAEEDKKEDEGNLTKDNEQEVQKESEQEVQSHSEEEVKKEQESHENINVVHSDTASEPVSITSDEKPEEDEPEVRPEEDTTHPHGTEENSLPDSNEAGSVVSETIHQGTPAPEITNEINEEKDSSNQITSDDTSTSVTSDNQQQNEVSNELVPGENIEETKTEHPTEAPQAPEETHHIPSETISEPSHEESSPEVAHSEDSLIETTFAPAITPEEPPSSSEESSHEPATVDNEQESANEDNSNVNTEEKPSEEISGEPHSDLGVTTVQPSYEDISSPTGVHSIAETSSETVSSDKTHEEASQEQTETHIEDKPHDEISSGMSEEQSSNESIKQTNEENTDTEQSSIKNEPELNEAVTEKISDEQNVPGSQQGNKDNSNEISTEKAQEHVPETSEQQVLESHTESTSDDNVKTPSASEDLNAIVEDVTHVESNVPQVPDSANQLLETSANEDESKTTVQPLSENEVPITHITSEEQPSSQDNVVKNEENVPSEDNKTEQITETESQSQQETGGEQPQTESSRPTENGELPSEHHEIPHQELEHHETPQQELEHHEISQPQEIPSEEHIPSENVYTTAGPEEASSEKQEIAPVPQETSEHQDTSPEEAAHDHQEVSSESQETVTQLQETATEHQGIVSDHQETVSEQQEPISGHEESSSEKQEVGTDQQETSSEHQEIGEHHEIVTDHQETAPEHQETVTETQETGSQHQESSSEPLETVSPHEETSSEHQTGGEQDVVSPDQNELLHQGTGADSISQQTENISQQHEIVTEQHELVTERLEDVTEYHVGDSEHHDSSSEGQVAEHQESSTDQQPLEHQEPSTEQQLVDHESSTEQQGLEHHESSTEQGLEHHESSTEQGLEHHEPSTEQQGLEHHEPSTEQPELEHHESSTEQQGLEHHESSTEPQELEHHEPSTEQQGLEHHEPSNEQQGLEHHESITEQQGLDHHESSTELQGLEHQENTEQEVDHHNIENEKPEVSTEIQEVVSDHQEQVIDQQGTTSAPLEHIDHVPEQETVHQEPISEHHEIISEHEVEPQHQDNISEDQNAGPEHQISTEATVTEVGQKETSSEHYVVPHTSDESIPEQQESVSEHHDTISENELHIPITESSDKELSTGAPHAETSPETVVTGDHASTEGLPIPNDEISPESQTGHSDVEAQKQEVPTTQAPQTEVTSQSPPPSPDAQKPDQITELIQSIAHSTETASIIETPSSTQRPIVEEPSPMFPTWSQKPFDHHTTPEPHTPDENPYPSGYDPEYEDEEGASYGPGTCRYGGKVYLSAQQIPRDDPCDFCFCFRSDIICLQQSCPPPIRGCYQETIKGFCCPRYECHVSMATMLNITTTTTTTTTTLPPHFFAHAYNGAATKAGCQVKGVAYHVGERIPSTSGPCLECRCGANGQMKCDPTVCGPQEALLRQVMDAAVSKRRR